MEEETKPPFVQETTTTTTSKAPVVQHGESQVFGLSIRSIVVILITGTVCYMSLRMLKIEEPLYTLATITIGYYFGQNQTKPQIKT